METDIAKIINTKLGFDPETSEIVSKTIQQKFPQLVNFPSIFLFTYVTLNCIAKFNPKRWQGRITTGTQTTGTSSRYSWLLPHSLGAALIAQLAMEHERKISKKDKKEIPEEDKKEISEEDKKEISEENKKKIAKRVAAEIAHDMGETWHQDVARDKKITVKTELMNIVNGIIQRMYRDNKEKQQRIREQIEKLSSTAKETQDKDGTVATYRENFESLPNDIFVNFPDLKVFALECLLENFTNLENVFFERYETYLLLPRKDLTDEMQAIFIPTKHDPNKTDADNFVVFKTMWLENFNYFMEPIVTVLKDGKESDSPKNTYMLMLYGLMNSIISDQKFQEKYAGHQYEEKLQFTVEDFKEYMSSEIEADSVESLCEPDFLETAKSFYQTLQQASNDCYYGCRESPGDLDALSQLYEKSCKKEQLKVNSTELASCRESPGDLGTLSELYKQSLEEQLKVNSTELANKQGAVFWQLDELVSLMELCEKLDNSNYAILSKNIEETLNKLKPEDFKIELNNIINPFLKKIRTLKEINQKWLREQLDLVEIQMLEVYIQRAQETTTDIQKYIRIIDLGSGSLYTPSQKVSPTSQAQCETKPQSLNSKSLSKFYDLLIIDEEYYKAVSESLLEMQTELVAKDKNRNIQTLSQKNTAASAAAIAV